MGLCLLFLPNFPGATFIQGGTFIPDSRVCKFKNALIPVWIPNFALHCIYLRSFEHLRKLTSVLMKADKEMNKGDTFLWNTQCRFLYFDAFHYRKKQ